MSKAEPHSDDGEIELDGVTLEFEVRHSEEATEPRIDIDINGVRVVLPADSTTDPHALLTENSEWVLQKKTKYDRYRERAPDRRFEPGEEFPYLGDQYELVTESRSSSVVEDEAFRLAEHHVGRTSIRRTLEQLYRRKARDVFTDRADHFADEMGVDYDALELRNQRTLWGSCSDSGTLSLNWRLVMAPENIVDYVIVHELAHLLEPNHTRRFWQLVGEQLPDYQQYAAWLKENSVDLIFTEDDL